MKWLGLLVGAVVVYAELKASRHRRNDESGSHEASLASATAGRPSSAPGPRHSPPAAARRRGMLERLQRAIRTLASANDIRREHLDEFTSGEHFDELTSTERQLNGDLRISMGSLGLSIAGALFYRPLSFLGALGVLHVTSHFVKDARKSLFEERRVRTSVVDVILIPCSLLLGYFVVSSLTTCLVVFSRRLMLRTEHRSLSQLGKLFAEQARLVWVLRDQVELQIPMEDLQSGETVVVGPGETISIDGVIADGIASIDQHALTGESQPVEKGQGDRVLASTVVLSGRIHITVEDTGSDTIASQIVHILDRTADYRAILRSRGIEFADSAALPTLVLGAVGLLLVGRDGAVALLTANFGYNMRFLSPLTMLNYLHVMSRQGILIKDGRSLELIGELDTIVFDKTGTLTLEQPHIGDIYTCSGLSEDAILTYAATAEHRQTHPIAKAIVQEAERRGLRIPELDEAKYEVGYGIRVTVSSRRILVGSARFMEMEGIEVPPAIVARQVEADTQGHSLVYLAMDDHLRGAIGLHPTIRPEAASVIRHLRRENMSTFIISGDQEPPPRTLAEKLGIDHYFAEVLPEGKAVLIERLQQEGRRVCFVGDGINDAIALKKARVSVSLRGASMPATDTAQIILLDGSLHQLAHLFELAEEFDANMDRNILASVAPGFVIVSGVFLFNLRLFGAMVACNLGLLAGLVNSMWPLIEHQDPEPGLEESRHVGASTETVS